MGACGLAGIQKEGVCVYIYIFMILGGEKGGRIVQRQRGRQQGSKGGREGNLKRTRQWLH